MERTGTAEVNEAWLCKMLVAMAPVLRGREAARRSYSENCNGHARRIVARTDDDRLLLAGWHEYCRALGLDDDLRHW